MSQQLIPSLSSQSKSALWAITDDNELTDAQLIKLWLYDKSPQYQKKAIIILNAFLKYLGKSLHQVTLEDLQNYLEYLREKYPNLGTLKNHLAAIKSLFNFGHKIGYLRENSSTLIKVPKLKEDLAERIISPEKILQMIALEPNPRNRLILKILYATGIRASELCGLKWHDVQTRGDGLTQISVYGKGSKTRSIILPQSFAKELLNFRENAPLDAPVFHSKKKKYGGHLHVSTLEKIVKAARERAEIEEKVSPHFFRHSHASHALEQGAPVHLVRDTLGHSSIKTTARYLHVRPEDSSGRFLMD